MRVTIYDKTPGSGFLQKMLMYSWLVGCWLQKLFGKVDDYHGVSSIEEMETWLHSKNTTFSSIQYWGHGSPGVVWISRRPHFDSHWDWLAPMLTTDSVVWFRVCSLFQGLRGEAFSRLLANTLSCTIAGHTRTIGLWQGGLYTRTPNSSVSWSLSEGTENRKWKFLRDDFRFWNRHTVFCLTTKIPKGW